MLFFFFFKCTSSSPLAWVLNLFFSCACMGFKFPDQCPSN